MVFAIGLSALEGNDEIRLKIVMGEVALLRTTGDGPRTGVCPVTAVTMVTEGHPCDVSTTLKPLLDFPPFFLEIVRRAFEPSSATSWQQLQENMQLGTFLLRVNSSSSCSKYWLNTSTSVEVDDCALFCLPTCFWSTLSHFLNAIFLLISCVDSLRLAVN